jgi:hypothetical protein
VSGDTTRVTSLICATSSWAATRGATFLPWAVAGKRMVAVFTGHRDHLCSDVLGQLAGERRRIGVQHLAPRPASAAAACGHRSGLVPGHQHVHVETPNAAAAVTVLSVAGFRDRVVVFRNDEDSHGKLSPGLVEVGALRLTCRRSSARRRLRA